MEQFDLELLSNHFSMGHSIGNMHNNNSQSFGLNMTSVKTSRCDQTIFSFEETKMNSPIKQMKRIPTAAI